MTFLDGRCGDLLQNAGEVSPSDREDFDFFPLRSGAKVAARRRSGDATQGRGVRKVQRVGKPLHHFPFADALGKGGTGGLAKAHHGGGQAQAKRKGKAGKVVQVHGGKVMRG